MARLSAWGVLALTTLLVAPAFAASTGDAPTLLQGPQGLFFQGLAANDGGTLTVTGPEDFVYRHQFATGASAGFDISGDMTDGLYSYELVLHPRVSAAERREMARLRAAGDAAAADSIAAKSALPGLSGYFTLRNGAIVSNEVAEQAVAGAPISADFDVATGAATFNNLNAAAQVFVTDVIIQGSECVGFDCVSSESFGFDTERLKENNLRLHFDDTSNSASFPSNDWRIVANDTTNGGANYLSFQDATAGTTPFRVLAGAGNNALYVDAQGDVGLNTNNPVVELHIADGDSPTLRLEQNGSSGFTPQTWDVAGNETNFFVRDVTNGSKLPFRIRPSAPDNSIYIDTDGDVGLGTNSPAASLHVRATDGTAAIFVDEASSSAANRTMLSFSNLGPVAIQLDNTEQTNVWQIRRSGSGLALDNDTNSSDAVFFDTGRVRFRAAGGTETFDLTDTGGLTIAGTLTQNSDRTKKKNIRPVAGDAILEKVMTLPIATWEYRKGDPGVTHLGPMAQDFHALFGLGIDDRHIATIDTSGVALAAIQALGKKLEQKQEEIDTLKARLEALEARLSQ